MEVTVPDSVSLSTPTTDFPHITQNSLKHDHLYVRLLCLSGKLPVGRTMSLSPELSPRPGAEQVTYG